MTCGRSTRLVFIALAGLLVLPGLALAQNDASRTAWGAPDLQGVGDFRTVTPMECPGEPGGETFLTEEKAVQAAVNRDIEIRTSAARRTAAGGSVGGYENFWMNRGSMMLAGFAQAQEERRVTCTYIGENPFIVELSKVCGACGGDICVGAVECRVRGFSRITTSVVYCPAGPWGACPDATTCAYDSTFSYRDATRIIDQSQGQRSDPGPGGDR